MSSSLNFLNTKVTKSGRKTIYKILIEKQGSVKKLVEYLKSDKIPEYNSEYKIKHLNVNQKTDINFEKHVKALLPQYGMIQTYLGKDHIVIKYDIAHDDNMIVLLSTNPQSLQGLFNFTETITITENDGILTLEREAKIFNVGSYMISNSFEMYDDHFNNQSIGFFLAIIDDINSV